MPEATSAPAPAPAPAPTTSAPAPAPTTTSTPVSPNGGTGGTGGPQTIASGNTPEPAAEAPYWPTDWREKIAGYVAAGNKDVEAKELARLQKMADPVAVFSNYRQIENTWASRNFVKLPPKDAKPEDIAEFHKALGVPEKVEDYFKDYQPANGAVFGDADKPVAQEFAAEMHKAGAPPAVVHQALNWYFQSQEKAAAALDEADENFRVEAQRALKEELGGALKRHTNNIGTLFKFAPGGSDVENPNALISRILGGRTADGKIIGNDPEVFRWMMSLAKETNPVGAVVEDAGAGAMSIDSEIEKIEKTLRSDRAAYNKDTKMQTRYRELLEARNKSQARKSA